MANDVVTPITQAIAEGKLTREKVAAALVKYQLDPNKPNPLTA